MERIKKALDLAKLAREEGAGAATLGSVTPLAHKAQPAPVSHTRSLKLSSKHLERNRVLHADCKEAVRHAYNMLRTQVLQRMREHDLRVLAVASPKPAEGKSLTALNLAISIAQDPNHTALLVELDLMRPTLRSLLGIEVEHGIDDYLRGRCALSQALYRSDQHEHLVVLPARGPLERSSELLASQHVRDLVAEIRARYADRIVIVDLPPVLLSDDALVFAPCVDATLVVVAEGQTRREDLARTMELLQSTVVVGTVLNKSRDASAGVY